jgi:glycosyltransferase involved in cell wall biosynthesis
VGSADDRVRRPSMFLELATRMPECKFVMILVPAMDETERRCKELASQLTNVTLVGRTPFRDIERYYAEAKLLVNTSKFEGFPNSFLQAAKYGVPIVAAAVDPGGMLLKFGCGLVSNDDIEMLESNVRRMLSDDALYGKCSENSLRYVSEYHDSRKVIPWLEAALLESISPQRHSIARAHSK